MIRLALASASDRFADGKVVVLDSWGIDTPAPRRPWLLERLGIEGRACRAHPRRGRRPGWKSLRNLPQVHVLTTGELNAYDVLVSDWVVFTRDSLPSARPAAGAGTGAGAASTEADR